MPKKALGRGLNAILQDSEAVLETEDRPGKQPGAAVLSEGEERPLLTGLRVIEVPVDQIRANPRQPRRSFDPVKLSELAASIGQEGVLQPILVRETARGFELVAGERRWRACQAAGLTAIPSIVIEVDDRESLKLALVENLQRDDLNPIEEAHAYNVLIAEFGWTQEELGAHLGKDRSTVANFIRLLQLPEEVQEMLSSGFVSAGHARPLVGLEDKDGVRIARLSAKKQLSVRQTERLAKKARADTRAPAARAPIDPVVQVIQDQMESRLGLPVKIQYRRGRGKVELRFSSDGELERMMQVLGIAIDGT